MKFRILPILCFLSLLLLSVEVRAQGIHMLPPVDFSAAEDPCTSTTGGVLQWDGTTAIKCIKNFYGDKFGNVSLFGFLGVASGVEKYASKK